MRFLFLLFIVMQLVLLPVLGLAQGVSNSAVFAEKEELGAATAYNELKPGEEQSSEEVVEVLAVYGVTADDYLVPTEAVQKSVRPKARRASSQVSLNSLPDAVFFVGGPVLVVLLLGVVVTILKSLEEEGDEDEGVHQEEKL